MPIPSLPEEISIFTVRGGMVQPLMAEVAINREALVIAPTDLEGAHWMTDFRAAVQEGMGVIIKDPEKVKQIDLAEWLLVVGINETADSRTVIEEILRRNLANGELAILAQDAPTSNTDEASTGHRGLNVEAEAYLAATRMRLPQAAVLDEPVVQIRQRTLDAQRLVWLLGLDPDSLSGMPAAHLKDMTEAAAMAALLWIPCTHLFAEIQKPHLQKLLAGLPAELRKASLGEFFLNHVRARGAFPILRIEDNPYGILPVISLRDYCSPSEQTHTSAPSGEDRLCSLIKVWKSAFLKIAEETPQVGATDDDIYEELLEILRQTAVSRRVDVREFDSKKPLDMSADAKFLNCGLVKEKNDELTPSSAVPYPETIYLHQLSRINQSDFKEEDIAINDHSPLLKRIIHFYLQLERPKKKKTTGGTGLPSMTPATMASPLSSTISGSGGTVGTKKLFELPGGTDLIAEAAALLSQILPDKLEILLVETLDLFSHRLDAWLTGLAYKRLQECRSKADKRPPSGVYGWLEAPGKIGQMDVKPEFIQAPSVKQAITSAILRNASIHNGTSDNSGAFQINLSSDQVRKGLWYMEGLRQGHLPGELLGYRLERMIHEEAAKSQPQGGDPDAIIKETDIFDLRDDYPLALRDYADQASPSGSVLTVIDGEKFLKKNQDEKYKHIRARLNQIKDAAADVALCEVVHADDNIARRGGWLDFLEGDALPPQEEFVTSVRTGDIHGTKIFMVIPTPNNLAVDETVTEPRIIADPLLASFCESLLPDFSSKEVVANLGTKDGSKTRQIVVQVQELNMQPIDLVIGGMEELLLRLRYYLLSRWQVFDSNSSPAVEPFHILGPFPDFATTDELLNEMRVKIVPPDSPQDADSIAGTLEKVQELRDLLHRNRSKNGTGTLHPEDLPIIDQGQLENVDNQAHLTILSNRITRIGERLVNLVRGMIAASSELKRRNLILLEIRAGGDSVSLLRDEILANDEPDNVTQGFQRLKDKLQNLSDMDPEFETLAMEKGIWAQINLAESDSEQISSQLESLIRSFTEIEVSFAGLVESTAQNFVASADSLLFEMSQFGLEKALTPLPAEPTAADAQKIVRLLEQLLVKLVDKLVSVLPDVHPLKDPLQILKVVYLYDREMNQVLLRYKGDPVGLKTQLLNRLPLTPAQSQYISSISFSNFSYFAPLLALLDNDLQSTFAGAALTADIEQSSAAAGEKTAALIARLQALTDGEAMTVLTPYLLQEVGDGRPPWEIDFSLLNMLSGATYLQEYREVRPAVNNLYELFDFGSELTIYADKYHQRLDPLVSSTFKEGHTDFLYLTLHGGSTLKTKYLTMLLVDQWQEGIPNPEQRETTGIALRYPTPPAEAPNAIIVAVPPKKNKNKNWTTKLLANTLLETIELMQIRMVSSEAVHNYLVKLPALLFPPRKSGGPLFPSRERLLHGFDIGAAGGYVMASQLSPTQLSKTTGLGKRDIAPNLEDSDELK